MRTEEDTIEAGHCTLSHTPDDGEYVEADENWDSTYQCPNCGDQWTEYER